MLRPRRSRVDKAPQPDPGKDPGENTGTDVEKDKATDTDIARRVLAHAASPEEKLERLFADRSRELEDQAARFEQAMQDLERREELLRDMRVSVERLLRLGASDLTEREVELQELGREFMEREARLSTEEAELNRRRSELGAVELKREAVEQRERALAIREEEVEAAETRRESDQGAGSDTVTLLFVPGAAYRLVEVDPRELSVGAMLELDGESYLVTRLARAPFPADARRCAYLELAAPSSSGPGSSESSGSS